MIGYIKGKIIDKVDDAIIIIDASNVGWEINIGNRGYLIDTEIELYIYTNVRENEISLWGFSNSAELKIFKLLLTVSGIGTKTAFNIVQEKGVNNIINSILSGSAEGLKASGVGPKTTQKIILDLKEKVSKLNFAGSANQSQQDIIVNAQEIHDQEVYEVLESLGYRSYEIKKALATLKNDIEYDINDTLEKRIKKVLKLI